MMRLHPGVLCVAFCTGCWCRWRAWLCARDARRTSRSSCCATNSQSCAGRTTDQRSPTRTGPCWVRSRRPCPDGGELAGSSRQRPCCVGTDAESPATGPNFAGRLGGPAPLWSCVTSSSTWPPTTPPGVTAASPANSPVSATGSEHRQCGESSNSTASTSPHSARWIGTLRRELLDRTIIWNQRQLQRLVIDYIDHYNMHRPHRSLDQRPPRHTTPDNNTTDHPLPLRLVRTTRCDGLINEYKQAA